MPASMGGTVSVRNAGVARGDVRGLLRHHFRDVDREHGVEVKHSNADIVDTRTAWNESFVNDGAGGLRGCTDVKEVADYIDARLDGLPPRTRTSKKTGKVTEIKTRKDFPVLRDWVLELDPDAMKRYNDLLKLEQELRDADKIAEAERVHANVIEERDEIRRLLIVMIETVRKEVGADNFVGGSIHWDETNPHAQILTLPIHEEKLNWKAFRPGNPKGLSQFHDVVRQNLRDAGYAAIEERVTGSRKHLSLKEFKETKDLLVRAQELGDVQAQRSAAADLLRRAEVLEHRHGGAEHRERQLNRREKSLDQREHALVSEEAKLAALRQALEAQRERVEAERASVVVEKEQILSDARNEAKSITTEALKEALRVKTEAREHRDALKDERSGVEAERVKLAQRLTEADQTLLAAKNSLEYADDYRDRVLDAVGRQEAQKHRPDLDATLRGHEEALRAQRESLRNPDTPQR